MNAYMYADICLEVVLQKSHPYMPNPDAFGPAPPTNSNIDMWPGNDNYLLLDYNYEVAAAYKNSPHFHRMKRKLFDYTNPY